MNWPPGGNRRKRDYGCRGSGRGLQAHLDWICSLLPRNTVRELKEPTNEIRACLETFRKTLVTKVAGEQLPLIREYLRIFAGSTGDGKKWPGGWTLVTNRS